MTAVEGQPDDDHPMTAVEAVAHGFLEAYGAFDTDRAITYLADDADIIRLINWFTTEDMQGTRGRASTRRPPPSSG